MKQCAKCQAWLSREDFSQNKRMRDGLQVWCKGCMKAYREENRERMGRQRGRATGTTAEYYARWYAANRDRRREYLRELRESKRRESEADG